MLNLIGDSDRNPKPPRLHPSTRQSKPAESDTYQAQRFRKYARQGERCCLFVGCTTGLSRFNRGEYCSVHEKGSAPDWFSHE